MAGLRVCLFISEMNAGGAQRVMFRLAEHWVKCGHDVHLVTLSTRDSDFFQLPDAVTRHELALMKTSVGPLSGMVNNVRRVRALRDALCSIHPDVVLSFLNQSNILMLMATRGLNTRTLISERIDPAREPLSAVWRWLQQRLYPKADTLIVQTDKIARWFKTQGIASCIQKNTKCPADE